MSVICETCGVELSNKSSLSQHIAAVHLRRRDFVCEICNQAFFSKSKLKFHQHKHSNERNYLCEICTKSFKTGSDLNQHKRTHFKGLQTCVDCHLVFKNIREYDKHFRTIHVKKVRQSTECNICKKTFSAPNKLRRHLKNVHEKIKEHKCEMCGKEFSESNDLKTHVSNVHLKERKHICFICNKSFSKSYTLKSHIRNVHDGKKIDDVFPCKLCGITFFQKSALTKHVNLHGKSNLMCDFCGDFYPDKRSILIHLATHNPNFSNVIQNKHTCKFCGVLYTSSKNLDRHLKTMHGPKIRLNCDAYQHHKTPEYFNCIEIKNEPVVKKEIDAESDNEFEPIDWQQDESEYSKLSIKLETKEVETKIRNKCLQHEVKLEDNTIFPSISESSDHDEKETNLHIEFTELGEIENVDKISKKEKNPLYINIKNHCCQYCDKKFSRTNLLRDHVDFVHKKLLKFKCEICEKLFGHHSSLKRHLLSFHSRNQKLCCELCSKEFKASGSLMKHRKLCEQGTKCVICDREFSTAHARNQHFRSSHVMEKKFICDYCDRGFSKKNNLQTHILGVHLKQKLESTQCSICRQEFLNVYQLKKHRIQVHAKGTVNIRKCGLCDQEFQLFLEFKKHVNLHENCFICLVCGSYFETLEMFSDHEKIHKTVISSRVVCDVCGISLAHKYSLAVHMRIHLDIYPFVCDLCGKKYKYATSFAMHKNAHEKIKNFQCEMCKKCFTTKQGLKLHLGVHGNEKLFSCDYCEKKFLLKQSRDLHLRRHLGQFKCETCGRNCSSQQSLSCHQLQHSGHRPFVCLFCPKSYTFGKNLKMHVRKNHSCEVDVEKFIESIKN